MRALLDHSQRVRGLVHVVIAALTDTPEGLDADRQEGPRHRRYAYGVGESGRNRVRVFPDPKTGLYQVEWREDGRGLTRSLGHLDWTRTKKQADEFGARAGSVPVESPWATARSNGT